MINTIYAHVREKPPKGYLFVLFPKLGTVSPNSNIQQHARKYREFQNFYIVTTAQGDPRANAEPPQHIQGRFGGKKTSVKENPNYSRC
jgi:hypothetical protein